MWHRMKHIVDHLWDTEVSSSPLHISENASQ